MKEGFGEMRYANGDMYRGEFLHDKPHGPEGSCTFAHGGQGTGDFRNGLLHGHGAVTYGDSTCYMGGFSEGEFHGRGILRYPSGTTFTGWFEHGKMHGRGCLTSAAGNCFGEWQCGKLCAGASLHARQQSHTQMKLKVPVM